MEIYLAKRKDAELVYDIVKSTISEIYPHYYPKGAVNFFLSLHSIDNILKDIDDEFVYLLTDGKEILGTVTIKDNEICRLFVLPKFQGRGFGNELADFAEKSVFNNFEFAELAASLPAKGFYIKREYKETKFDIIKTENGDCLCYDTMEKQKFERGTL